MDQEKFYVDIFPVAITKVTAIHVGSLNTEGRIEVRQFKMAEKQLTPNERAQINKRMIYLHS